MQSYAKTNPIFCKYISGGLPNEVPCNNLRAIEIDKNKGIYKDYSNVCIYKSGSWQLGSLVPTDTGRHKFIVERSCSGGVTVKDHDPALAEMRGPSRRQAYIANPKVTATDEGSGSLYDSSAYFGSSVDGLSLRSYNINTEIILACGRGDISYPCSNADSDSTPNSVNFCAPKDFGSVGIKLGRHSYKGFWYVRYTLENKANFEICNSGVTVADAQTMANKNQSPITLLTHISTTSPSTFIQTYNDGKYLSSGLENWYIAGGVPKRKYRGMGACIVNASSTSIIKYNCANSVLTVGDTVIDENSTITGYCYASVRSTHDSTTPRAIKYQTGEGLVDCNEIELVRKRTIDPN